MLIFISLQYYAAYTVVLSNNILWFDAIAEDVNRSLEARLQVVEQALAAVGESRVAMELAEAKVQLADQELHQMELRHVAHKERQARARADEQVTLLKEQLRKATNV